MTCTIYVCVGIPIPLKFDKLHCIIIAMSCMLTYDHADSFPVVVSVHPLFVVVLCFFSDRMLRDVVSNDKFFGVLRRSCQASFPTPYLSIGVLITYLCLCFMLYASLVFRCFVQVTYPIHLFSPKQNYISTTSRLLPFACCLSWPCES
jgi:hypothetical protein